MLWYSNTFVYPLATCKYVRKVTETIRIRPLALNVFVFKYFYFLVDTQNCNTQSLSNLQINKLCVVL